VSVFQHTKIHSQGWQGWAVVCRRGGIRLKQEMKLQNSCICFSHAARAQSHLQLSVRTVLPLSCCPVTNTIMLCVSKNSVSHSPLN